MQIVQIVPRLPPAVDGVGDYAYLLARQLRAAHGIQTVFVVCDTKWKNAETLKAENRDLKSEIGNRKSEINLDGFPIHQLKERSATELLRVLNRPGMPNTALLQYVGYGYQKRGCPLWLARALRTWKLANQPERRLLTMFHELYAKGLPWKSEFWLGPAQKWVVKTLANLSDHTATNLTICALTLQQMTQRPGSAITVLPVFSNVGELKELPNWNQRPPRMVVFGGAAWRRQVYNQHRNELENACQALGLDEIVDIGSPVEFPALRIKVTRRGILSATDISHEMANARAGFFSYPVNCLGKSGIFAAYAAHGLVPITAPGNRSLNEDGLKRGKHFLVAGEPLNHAAQTSLEVYQWYQPHSLAVQARQLQILVEHS